MDILLKYVLTPISVFVVGYILLRVMGKKAVSEMTSFDLLIIIILGTTMAGPIVTKQIGKTSYFGLAITLVYLAFSYIALENKFKKVLTNSPTVLVRNGDIDEDGLRKTRLTIDQLLAQLRTKGYANVNDLALVVLEETGKISAIPMANKRPIQPNDLNMEPSPTFIPIPIIIDGEVVEHNLKYIKKDIGWLQAQLQAHNLSIDNLTSITLATLNQQGFLNIDTTNPHDRSGGVNNYKPGDSN